MLRSESRQRYVTEFRRRTAARERKTSKDSCLVCQSTQVRQRTVTYEPKQKTFTVTVCRDCGHVSNPDNFNDYTQYTSLEKMPVARRVGTAEKPGREYHMATMGSEILGKRGLSIMLYGPGRSVDYRRIQELDQFKRVAIGDLMRFIDDAEWVDLNVPAQDRFDLVLASEVIEHFTDPPEDFEKLFSYVKDDGIVICSTNIYDGGDLNKHNYLFILGHTSYYSPQAIVHLAKQNGIFFDFRVPKSATTYAGPRKRYVLFTRSVERLQHIAEFFGDHTYGPSEK